jgi:hypothetical protein
VGLANLGSESETCVGCRVHLVGVSISFEKNFYQLPFTPPSLVCRISPSGRRDHGPEGVLKHDQLPLVLDGDEAGHLVFCVSERSFAGFVEDFTSVGCQANIQVSWTHS